MTHDPHAPGGPADRDPPDGARRRSRPARPAPRQSRAHRAVGARARRELLHGGRPASGARPRPARVGRGQRVRLRDPRRRRRRPPHRARRAVERRARAVAERDARLLDRPGRARQGPRDDAPCGSSCASPSSTPACTACSRRSSPATSGRVRVAEKAGFRLEGRALRYLQIAGDVGGPRRLRPHRRGLEGDGGAVGRLRCSRALPATRLRRLRGTPVLRDLVRETRLEPRRLRPAAVRRGGARRPQRRSRRCPASTGSRSPRPSRRPARRRALGIPAVLLFGIPADKDEEGSGAWDDEGIVQLATRAIKDAHPDLLVIDRRVPVRVHDHGHCGLLRDDGRSTTTRASSCSRAPRSRRRAPAPTSSRRAT